jgi:hypothetical protein
VKIVAHFYAHALVDEVWVRDFPLPLVPPTLIKRVVWIWRLMTKLNDCFGDIGCIAAKDVLQVREDAA